MVQDNRKEGPEFSDASFEQETPPQQNSEESQLSLENLPQVEHKVDSLSTEEQEEMKNIIEKNRQQIESFAGETIQKENKEGELVERKMVEQFDKEKVQATQKSASKGGDDQEDDDTEHVQRHAEQVYQIADPKEQIERIIQLAMNKDPFFAVKVARHLDDNYILNEVHDRLVEDQVREELLKRGLIQDLY